MSDEYAAGWSMTAEQAEDAAAGLMDGGRREGVIYRSVPAHVRGRGFWMVEADDWKRGEMWDVDVDPNTGRLLRSRRW